MSEETARDTGNRPAEAAAPAQAENRSFGDILKALVGKSVTVVNPQSFEAAPVGYKLTDAHYRGKVTALGRDYIVMVTEFEKKKGAKEPVKQFIPTRQIQRISVMPKETFLHL
jgi:hypothetical protein